MARARGDHYPLRQAEHRGLKASWRDCDACSCEACSCGACEDFGGDQRNRGRPATSLLEACIRIAVMSKIDIAEIELSISREAITVLLLSDTVLGTDT
jgi:hypothetical protein